MRGTAERPSGKLGGLFAFRAVEGHKNNNNVRGPIMTDDEMADLRALCADAGALLQAVRVSLTALLRRVMEGDASALKDLATKQAELESALKRVFEAEAKYHDQCAARGRGGDDVDYGALREEIACRLNRLREC